MSQHKLASSELQFLQRSLNEGQRSSTLRLREGEYQYNLAKAIGSFQLELYFPDVKDIVNRLYGEEKTDDVQFIRKIQTILKKMEKSNIVKILPKKKPWELQRYALLSFRFQDAENSFVSFGTEDDLERARSQLQFSLNRQIVPERGWANPRTRAYIFALAFIVVISYGVIIWDVIQPVVSPLAFVSAFCVSILGSIALGKILSRG